MTGGSTIFIPKLQCHWCVFWTWGMSGNCKVHQSPDRGAQRQKIPPTPKIHPDGPGQRSNHYSPRLHIWYKQGDGSYPALHH